MLHMITSPSDALDKLGGNAAVAGALKKPTTTVASWGARESIPVEVWPGLIALADDRRVDGITYQALVEAHANPQPKAKPAPRRRKVPQSEAA